MIKRRLCLFFIVALVEIATSMPSFGEWVWNKETGWMKAPSSDVTTIEQRYQYALSLVVEQKYLNAIKEFELIIDADPKSEYAETSRINIGWAYYLNGDCKKALKMYNTVLKKNPGTRRTMEVLEKMYQVGVSQMDTNEDEAINVFEQIIEKQRLGTLAPDAQIKIADCHFKLAHYEEAVDAYEKFLENYPKNAWVPYVQYRIPLSKVHHEKQQERNYGFLTSAKEGFEEYLVTNPNGIYVEDAKRMIREIRIISAEREFNIGEFYIRRKKPKAAVMYFQTVITEYPGTLWAEKAQEKINFLRMIEAIK
ncbi:MAG: outer membrane protein assembly factor BamD [Planctomycetota bacterium]